MRSLETRSFVVTGAGSGIGRAIAVRLAREGAAVALVGRREPSLRSTLAEIEQGRGRALVCAGDVADETTAERACGESESAFGRLDGFVHAAGDVVRDAPLEKTTTAQWNATFDAHVRALHHLTRFAVPRLRMQGGGAIVTIASNLAFLALPGLAAYSAAKGAVTSLTRALAVELGPERIRVNAIAPGLVETPLTTCVAAFPENRERYSARAPLRRIGRPDDVAGAAAFLLGNDAAWITGQTLVVDGGYAIA